MSDPAPQLPNPTDLDAAERARWEHSALRKRLLRGTWEDDLVRYLRREVQDLRRRAWGQPDTTKNTFRSVVRQLSVLYDREPVVSHEDSDTARRMTELLTSAGAWTKARRHQVNVVGMRESLWRVATVGPSSAPELQLRLVTPDTVLAVPHRDRPDTPVAISEWRERLVDPDDDSSDAVWTRDVLDVSDPGAPVYRIEDEDGADLTALYLGQEFSGEAYPYRSRDGAPILPYVLTHAEDTGHLWDPYEGAELVEGALVVAVLWTFWRHCVRDASWPQRYASNARPAGGVRHDDERNPGVGSVPTDPGSILLFREDGPGSAAVGQWEPGADPSKLGEAIRAFMADTAADWGLNPSDIQRVHADPRSGYAIAISRESIRTNQRRMEPQFRRGDLQLLETVAGVWGSATDEWLPGNGWNIAYPGLPLTADEERQAIERWEAQARLGVTSPVDLYRQIHQVDRDTAVAALTKIREDRVRFGGVIAQ